jgi:hypothetical protein
LVFSVVVDVWSKESWLVFSNCFIDTLIVIGNKMDSNIQQRISCLIEWKSRLSLSFIQKAYGIKCHWLGYESFIRFGVLFCCWSRLSISRWSQQWGALFNWVYILKTCKLFSINSKNGWKDTRMLQFDKFTSTKA